MNKIYVEILKIHILTRELLGLILQIHISLMKMHIGMDEFRVFSHFHVGSLLSPLCNLKPEENNFLVAIFLCGSGNIGTYSSFSKNNLTILMSNIFYLMKSLVRRVIHFLHTSFFLICTFDKLVNTHKHYYDYYYYYYIITLETLRFLGHIMRKHIVAQNHF